MQKWKPLCGKLAALVAGAGTVTSAVPDPTTFDLTKAKSHEVRMAIIHTLGLQSIALPEEIDKEFYDNERRCPSFFKREFHHRMFEQPVSVIWP